MKRLSINVYIKGPQMKKVKFANSVDPDEAALNEPPHLNRHCLPCCLGILNIIYLELKIFSIFGRCKVHRLFFCHALRSNICRP